MTVPRSGAFEGRIIYLLLYAIILYSWHEFDHPMADASSFSMVAPPMIISVRPAGIVETSSKGWYLDALGFSATHGSLLFQEDCPKKTTGVREKKRATGISGAKRQGQGQGWDVRPRFH